MKILSRLTRLGLSGKLLLRFIIATIVLLTLVALSLKYIFRDHFQENIRPHMVQYLDYVKRDIGFPPNLERAKILAKKLKMEIYIKTKDYSWSSSSLKINLDDIKYTESYTQSGIEYAHVHYKNRVFLLARYKNVSILYSIPDIAHTKRASKYYLLIILILFLALLYYIIKRLFYPIKVIREGVRHFGEGDLAHRIDVNRKDELGQLSDSINTMAGDIQQMLDAKRQLLLAISHELRTPLTRANVALALSDESSYKTQIMSDLKHMESLIEELLESERLSAKHNVLNYENVDVVELITSVKETYFLDSDIVLNLPAQAVHLKLDSARIKLLLKNLIENALIYSKEVEVTPQLTLKTDDKMISLSVVDGGKGIEPEHLAHLTEPFYRADPSRQRDTGGYGLGLYLCRMIVEAHGGQITIESESGQGTKVIISLPVR